jgi:hypothetical protein
MIMAQNIEASTSYQGGSCGSMFGEMMAGLRMVWINRKRARQGDGEATWARGEFAATTISRVCPHRV